MEAGGWPPLVYKWEVGAEPPPPVSALPLPLLLILCSTTGSDAHGDFQKRLHGVEYYIGAVRVERSQVALHPLQTENSEGEL